MKRAKAIKEEK